MVIVVTSAAGVVVLMFLLFPRRLGRDLRMHCDRFMDGWREGESL